MGKTISRRQQKAEVQTAAKTYFLFVRGSSLPATEISDADFKRLSKTGKAKVTNLRTGEVRTARISL